MPRTKIFLLVCAGIALPVQTMAQQRNQPFSQCMAVAQAPPGANSADLTPTDVNPGIKLAASGTDEVTIAYVGHSAHVITTAAGVTIATEYNGGSGRVTVPDVVTMNKAHSSHFTLAPDKRTAHVLRRRSYDRTPADHDVVVEDVYIRNVATDIRSFDSVEPGGNSIFIFEVADLCIGHLGHFHHALTDKPFAGIGRSDIVMVPADGGLTLSHAAMTGVARRLQVSIPLPMHRRGAPLARFIDMKGDAFATDYVNDGSFTISAGALPRRPTILVLKGV